MMFKIIFLYCQLSTMQTDRKSIAILDANAFISMTSITNLAANTRLITTADVLGEIRDIKTKEFVESLPFEIEVVDPEEKIVALVKDFAKKTGDIASLSLVDMELIAVAYAVYKREGLEGQLRKDPPPILERNDLEDYLQENNLEPFSEDSQQEEEGDATEPVQKSQNDKVQTTETKQEKGKQGQEQEEGWNIVPVKPKRKVSSSSSESDDEEAWITSKNYEKKMAQVMSNFKEEDQQQQGFNIWLISADFALQNVAVQMGIKLLSLDGRKISSIRRFIYECYLCWKKYRIFDEKVRLCSSCGYNSLSKVAYSLDTQGHLVLHRKRGWKPNQRILQVKERKFEEQERKKKHQNARRKKQTSIFDN